MIAIPQEGSGDPTVDENGKDIPIHKSSLPEAKWLNDLVSLYRDMQKTSEMLRVLVVENPNPLLMQALFASALIAYRRCFTQGLRKALSNDDVANSPNNAGWLHNELLTQADKLIAHSVNPFEETQSGFMVKEDKIIGVVTLSTELVNFHVDQTKQWGRLVQEILNTVLGPKINAARAALFEAGIKLSTTEITRCPVLEKNTHGLKGTDKRAS